MAIEVQSIWSDDGIAVRLPGGRRAATGRRSRAPCCSIPTRSRSWLTARAGGSALFAARFRENAARALLLPRRRPGQRTPLWMQRQRSADLLAVASQYGSFPIILETYREVLRDVFDMPALREVLAGIRARHIRVVSVETRSASPFASSLLFDYVGSFMYEGDAPLAERRAQALALDRELLAELLGSEELRELIDPAAVADLELELQALAAEPPGSNDRRRRRPAAPPRRPAHRRGRGTRERRSMRPTALSELEATRRAIRIRIAGEERWIAVEDAARYRDAVGASPPPGVAETFLAPVRPAARPAPRALGADPRPVHRGRAGRALGRGARRRRGPAAARWPTAGDLLEGAFRPGGAAHEFTDPDVLRQLRRRSLARLRREVEPVEHAGARALPARVARASARRPAASAASSRWSTQLEGVPLPASVLERDVLPARVAGYTPRLLDELGAGRRGRVDRPRVAGPGRRAGGALPARPRRPAGSRRARPTTGRRGRSTTRSGSTSSAEAHRSSRSCEPPGRMLATTTSCSTRCGTSSGRGRSRTTRSPRCGRCRCHARGHGARHDPGASLALGPPNAAGRWSLVADLVGRGALADRARPRAGARRCSSATAS